MYNFKFHESNNKEIDFYREGLTRDEYVNLLIDSSKEFKIFYDTNDNAICIAGVVNLKNQNWYWQFLTDKFPTDYIPKKFIDEYLEFTTTNLNKYERGYCTIIKENRFAKWLLLHGKKRKNWSVTPILEENDPDRVTYRVERGA